MRSMPSTKRSSRARRPSAIADIVLAWALAAWPAAARAQVASMADVEQRLAAQEAKLRDQDAKLRDQQMQLGDQARRLEAQESRARARDEALRQRILGLGPDGFVLGT